MGSNKKKWGKARERKKKQIGGQIHSGGKMDGKQQEKMGKSQRKEAETNRRADTFF